MIERHSSPVPDRSDVCHYIVSHPGENLDLRIEHTLTWICQSSLFNDLIDSGEPLPLQSLAVSGIGEPGPVARLEPRHWSWALMTDRNLMISIREGVIVDAS